MLETDPWYSAHRKVHHPRLEKILLLEQIDSTNSQAHRIRSQTGPVNVLILAREQTQGRGQKERSWESARDMGIWATLLLQDPDLLDYPLNLLSLYTGLTVQHVIQDLMAAPVRLKWPNDVLIDSRKVAGILTELQWQGNRVTSAVVGLGINVDQERQDFTPDVADQATSLRLEHSTELAPATLLQSVLDGFFATIDELNTPERFAERWNQVAWRINEELEFRQGAVRHWGQLLGVNPAGQIMIRQNGETRAYSNGEISLRF